MVTVPKLGKSTPINAAQDVSTKALDPKKPETWVGTFVLKAGKCDYHTIAIQMKDGALTYQAKNKAGRSVLKGKVSIEEPQWEGGPPLLSFKNKASASGGGFVLGAVVDDGKRALAMGGAQGDVVVFEPK
jgi:hypothetical protein